MAEVMIQVDKVYSKSNFDKSIAMATDAIEQNEGFVRSLYGQAIACELRGIIVCLFL